MLVELARHGSRAPVTLLGPKSEWVKKVGLGELTRVGMRQRYNLGLNTKARYANFLGTKLAYNEYHILSTNFNRTIMSAVSHIMGLQEKISDVPLSFAKDDERTLPPQKPLLFDPTTDPETPLPAGLVPFPTHDFIGK
jgi:hypothetical protein